MSCTARHPYRYNAGANYIYSNAPYTDNQANRNVGLFTQVRPQLPCCRPLAPENAPRFAPSLALRPSCHQVYVHQRSLGHPIRPPGMMRCCLLT